MQLNLEIDNIEEYKAKIEAEIREKIAKEEADKKAERKAKRASSKKSKIPKVPATIEDVKRYAVWTRTYDHLELDPRYDEWIESLQKTKQLYVDFETHTQDAVKPFELVKEMMEADNFKNIKTPYNKVLQEVKSRPLDSFKGKIRLIQLGDKKDTFVFDMYKMTPEQKHKIGCLIRDKFIIGHNLLFECKYICSTWGVQYLPAHCYDTMTVEKLICCSELAFIKNLRFDLQSVAERRAGVWIEKGYGDSDWGIPDLSEEQVKYAEEDVDVLRFIVKVQLPKLKNMGNNFVHIERDIDELKFLSGLRKLHLVAAIECDVIPCFARMIHQGIPINRPVLEEFSSKSDQDFQTACDKLGFNINSSPQTLDVLVNQYHLNIDSTGADALAPYYSKYEIVKDIVDARSVDTINGLLKGYLSAASIYGDDRVHPAFTVYQAYSGRTACREPNVQQVPRDLKPIWMKPPKGKLIFNFDLPGIELRLMSAYCKERTMIKAFRDGEDLHKKTAAKVNNIPEEEVTKDQRKKAKAVNFGYIYGCSAKRFKQTAMTKYQIDYPLEECQVIRDNFFKGYPDLDRHVRRMYKLFPYGVQGIRYVVKTFLGRRMMSDGATNALNFPVQGSCADSIKMSIIYFYYKLRNIKNGKYNDGSIEVVSMVHDELFVETIAKKLKFAMKLTKKAMELPINFIMRDFFPIKVEVEPTDVKGDWQEYYSEEELNEMIDTLNHS